MYSCSSQKMNQNQQSACSLIIFDLKQEKVVAKMDSLYRIRSKMLHSTKVIIFFHMAIKKIQIHHEGSMV